MRAACLLAATLAAAPALAQSVVTYQAPTGNVASTLAITMNLTGGGTAQLTPLVGSSCYLGQTCAFSGSPMSYALPDGTTASFSNLRGQFAPGAAGGYQVTARAAGTDSAGHAVVVSGLKVTMTIFCQRGCTKTYTDGKFRLTTK